ncbi:MAG: DUF5658 family protein [Desulfosarcinaceae bacterium]|nr:DUF5658 family protein [Desulfosarcinaceae bacterium]
MLSKQDAVQPVNQRLKGDRRQRRLPPLRYLFFNGRRRQIRREADHHRVLLLDHYSTTLFAAIVLILLFSLTDAFLTLWLVDRGATELNPVMAYFLAHGPVVFIGAKYALTCFSVVILVVFSHVFLRRVGLYIRTIITSILMLFSSVIAWEIYLLIRYVH